VISTVIVLASLGESPWPNAVEIAARTGYAVPLGLAGNGVPMRDALAGKVPLQLEGGYRALDRFYLGAYVEYGVGVGSPVSRVFCDAAVASDCTIRNFRFGGDGRIHFLPHAPFDPWIGIGFGYEVLTRRETNTSLRGWELLHLEAGGDGALGNELTLGPFVSATLTRYTISAATPDQYSETIRDIRDPQTHVWLSFGIRGAFRTLGSGSRE
jgi:outer membrane protein